MSADNPFALHYQSVWIERSQSVHLPAWQRVAFLAFGRHFANGHAPLAKNELRDLLDHLDSRTGEVVRADPPNVHRAIRRAVKEGWLSSESHARCLVVPPHAITGGLGTSRPCVTH